MYNFLRRSYWIVLSSSVLIISMPWVWPLIYDGELKEIYSSTLSFYYAIIGFFIAFIFFVVQYISTKLNSEELERLPISNVASVITILILFLTIMFNVICQSLSLKQPYLLISLCLFLLNLPLIILNLFMAIWMLNVSNILNLAAENSIRWLRKNITFKINNFIGGPIALQDNVIARLNADISVNLRIANSSIATNNRRVFVAAVRNIEKITGEYLVQSQQLICTEDAILTELDDSYNFCIDEALSIRNEKFLEDIAISIDTLLKAIILNRKTIGERQIFILPWIETLKQLFVKSFNKKRTKVCHQCIEFIGNASYRLLTNKTYRAFEETNTTLHDLGVNLSSTNSYWSAILLQGIISKLKDQFIYLALYYGKNTENLNTQYLSNHLSHISKIFVKAKATHSAVGHTSVIFASLYGIESFVLILTSKGVFSSQNQIFNASLIRILLDFNNKIISNQMERNDFRAYDVYPHLLYILFKHAKITDSHKSQLAEYASNQLLDVLNKLLSNAESEGRIDSDFEKSFFDFYAILIHFRAAKIKIVIKFIHKYIALYESITASGKENRNMYRCIKLMACWASHFLKINTVHSLIIKTLLKYYRDPIDSFPYGLDLEYPAAHINPSEVWYLPPNYLWGNPFQDELNSELNGDGSIYKKFHEFISNKAVSNV